MTTIYFVRHGEATGNRNKTFQGTTDNPLTELGIAQGKTTAQRFRDIPYDVIYSSPLVRAVETACLINLQNKPIIIDQRFIEVSGGEMEDKPVGSLAQLYPKEMELWHNKPHEYVGVNAQDGGVVEGEKRLKAAIAQIVAEHQDQTVLVTTHGLMLRIFNNWILGNCLQDIVKLGWGDNTCITCARFDNDLNPEVVFINDASHLTGDLTTRDHW